MIPHHARSIASGQIMNSKQDLMPREFGYQNTRTPAPLPVPGEYKFV
jgi:hypothetical protein